MGNLNENWFLWLKGELLKLGFAVTIPQFPTPGGQNLDNWNKVLEEFKDMINEDTVFVGHSLGSSIHPNNS